MTPSPDLLAPRFVARDKIEHGGKWYIVSTINRESSSPFAQGLTYAETIAFECDPDRGDKLLRIVAQDEALTGSTHAHKRMVARIRQYGDSEPVDEAPESWAEPEMCPNCVTPWKCNGPHEFPAASSEAAKVDGIHTPATCRHPHCNCEHGCVADPAPTTADAGVTEDAVDRMAFWLCARDGVDEPHALEYQGNPPEPYGEAWMRYRGDARAALEAALGAREGK